MRSTHISIKSAEPSDEKLTDLISFQVDKRRIYWISIALDDVKIRNIHF